MPRIPNNVILRAISTVLVLLSLTGCSEDECESILQPAHVPILIVSPDGEGQYPTIQTAALAAAPGDTIWLMSGIYSGPGNVDVELGDHAIMIRSMTGDPNDCIIDCLGDSTRAYAAFFVGSGSEGVYGFEGITIANSGLPESAPDRHQVAGVNCNNGAALVMRDCRFVGNSTRLGALNADGAAASELYRCEFEGNGGDWYPNGSASAAIFGRYSPTVLSECDFYNNHGDIALAIGDFCREVEVVDCRFVGNEAGAMMVAGEALISGCYFENNSDPYTGGALVLQGDYGSATYVQDCVFVSNHAARRGGAMYVSESIEGITGCLFAHNSAGEQGGAIYYDRGAGSSLQTIESCTLVFNSAPEGAGLFVEDGRLKITRTIIAFSQVGTGLVTDQFPTTIECTNLFGNEGGDWETSEDWLGIDGNISVDPQFCNADADNFELSIESPCSEASSACGTIGALGVGCE